MTESRDAGHFERLYQSNPDPWRFKTSPYEQAKYARTLSALGDRRFQSGLEVGCSIGVLTQRLGHRCDRLLGVDIVEDPLQQARSRCANQPHVRFQRMGVPTDWPDQQFDLIVFSEVLYFLSPADIDHCVHRVRTSAVPKQIVVLVNWLGPTDDPTPGNMAADRFITAAADSLSITIQERHKDYRLDVLTSQ
jgi:2-polyprenyl-3-methyl-5-hydroxy-6-metoxy-1,4-benzoquinol methylase